MKNKKMIYKKNWTQFRNAGLLWWINMQLHLFGWALCMNFDDKKRLVDVYPSRCKFRGFDLKSNDDGYKKLTKHIAKRTDMMLKDLSE